MKEKLPLLLVAAILASLTNSANAAPSKKTLIPAPPPSAYAVMPPPAKPTVAPAPAGPAVLQITPPATHVSLKPTVQRFVDNVAIKPGQTKMQMNLAIANGGDRRPGFSWFRMKLNGELLLTEKSLKGKNIADIDVSGVVPAGDNQFVIEGAGVPGATITWSLTAPPATVTGVEPKQASPGGTVVLKGKNFTSDVQQVNVLVGDSVGDVLAAKPNEIKIRIPDTASGDTKIALSMSGFPTITIPIKVAGFPPPQLKGLSLWSAPPGTKVQVRGKYFSPNPSANQVFFKGVAGQVTQADKDSLEVIVPSVGGSAREQSVPVYVMSNGLKSDASINFTIGMKATDKQYAPTVVFPENTTQSSSQSSSVSGSSSGTQSGSQNSSDPGSQSQYEASSQSSGFVIYHPLETQADF